MKKKKFELLNYESSARGVLERVKNEDNPKTEDKINSSKKLKNQRLQGGNNGERGLFCKYES